MQEENVSQQENEMRETSYFKQHEEEDIETLKKYKQAPKTTRLVKEQSQNLKLE